MFLFLLAFLNVFRLIFLGFVAALIFLFSRNYSLYFFLKFSGPIFIKLGQVLSSRPDIVGEDLAKRLSIFQDKVPAFACSKAKKIIEKDFAKKCEEIFAEFSSKPIASASIAQVYKCKTIDGHDVAVKVLRPNINFIAKRDVGSLKIIASLVSLFSKYHYERLLDVIEALNLSLKNELNLLNEAACGAALSDNLREFSGVYIPKIYFDLSTSNILIVEWIDGVALSNFEEIINSNIDRKKAAKNLLIAYFNQVYRDGFFHADMHPGNIFILSDARIALVDFGIVGILDKKIRLGIVRILMAFIEKDYEKVAMLHQEIGLISKEINILEFALHCRIIGQTVVDKSINNISFADLLKRLISMTQKYNMKTKPELLLLQKTIMLVEGAGVMLDKDLNIWDIAKPWVKDWAGSNMAFDMQLKDYFCDVFSKIKHFPEVIASYSSKSDFVESDAKEEIKSLKKTLIFWRLFAITSLCFGIYQIFNY